MPIKSVHVELYVDLGTYVSVCECVCVYLYWTRPGTVLNLDRQTDCHAKTRLRGENSETNEGRQEKER